LSVEVAGCINLRKGPSCAFEPDSPLRIWTETENDAQLSLFFDDRPPVDAPLRPGVLSTLVVPADARTLHVRAQRGKASTTRSIALTRFEEPAPIREANRLRAEGKLNEAQAALAPALEDTDPQRNTQGARVLARIHRARGKTDEAIALLRASIEHERETGDVSDEMQDRFALAYTLLYGLRSFSEARKALDDAAPVESLHPESKVTASYYRGLIAYETGDLRAALRLFRESAQGAERLGMTDHRRDVVQLLADVLSSLGRYDEASEQVRSLTSLVRGAPPCQRALFLNNLAWIALRTPEPDRALIDAQLREALGLFHKECPLPGEAGNVATNLAIAMWERGDAAASTQFLKEARASSPTPDPRNALWWTTIEGNLALEQKRTREALAHFTRLEDLGATSSMPEASLEGALGRAKSLAQLGDVAQARTAFARVDRLLDTWSLEVPLGEGRGTFLQRHERAGQARIGFLLAAAARAPSNAERTELLREAIDASRASHARIVRFLQSPDRIAALSDLDRKTWETALAAYQDRRASLAAEAAEDWRRPKDELTKILAKREAAHRELRSALEATLARVNAAVPSAQVDTAIPPGELRVHYVRGEEGWAALTSDEAHVAAHALGDVAFDADHRTLGQRLLAPLARDIASAKRIRIATHGPLRNVDFHALDLDGKPLIAHKPVVYAVDAPPRAAHHTATSRALVVGDPRGDLGSARKEAQVVSETLRAKGWTVRESLGTAATLEAVRAAIASPDLQLLHYAGHGVFEGHDGWESGLPLASGSWLTIGDVLALPRVPPRVVLSGCETAKGASSSAPALGIAQSFVAAGAREVVAATRPVDDTLAAQVVSRVMASLDASVDLATALARAQADLAEEKPGTDWATFRVLVP
jgi:tetratricopeptide (TPR) repeat protein